MRAVGGPAAGRRAARAAKRSASSRTRWSAPRSSTRQYGTQPGSGEAAAVLRRVLAQELVRRQGHARHRRQRRQLRDGRAESRLARRRRAPRPRAPSSTPWPRPPTSAVRPRRRRRQCTVGAARRQPRLRRPGAARPAIPTTPNACRAARAVARASSVAANLVACSICEQSCGFVQRAGVAQQRRQPPHHEGHSRWTAADG